ncbi:branched-chain amino acid transport system II carrier protein [Gottfriedia acidiceleris]|uniref:branched-chain amino acid transport system II carrier protein n=1 Tax=Gottfriedia acidiceleris TaxID=371036 RepID=UPI000B448DEA|nr:branched-chain amino acid transport system II carrier protein [Gottfriedia acidiceleris]
MYSLIEIINSSFLNNGLSDLLSIVPMQSKGFGWVIPGLIGFLIGCIMEKLFVKEYAEIKNAA